MDNNNAKYIAKVGEENNFEFGLHINDDGELEFDKCCNSRVAQNFKSNKLELECITCKKYDKIPYYLLITMMLKYNSFLATRSLSDLKVLKDKIQDLEKTVFNQTEQRALQLLLEAKEGTSLVNSEIKKHKTENQSKADTSSDEEILSKPCCLALTGSSTDSTITVNWTSGCKCQNIQYEVQRRDSNGDFQPTYRGTSTQYKIKNLDPSTTYHLQIIELPTQHSKELFITTNAKITPQVITPLSFPIQTTYQPQSTVNFQNYRHRNQARSPYVMRHFNRIYSDEDDYNDDSEYDSNNDSDSDEEYMRQCGITHVYHHPSYLD